jgi:hypothetical protein
MDRVEQLQTAARLKEAMEQTRALYNRAKQVLRQALEIQNDDVSAKHPRGALLYPIKLHNLAFRGYRRAVLRYNRFLLDGVPQRKRKGTI